MPAEAEMPFTFLLLLQPCGPTCSYFANETQNPLHRNFHARSCMQRCHFCIVYYFFSGNLSETRFMANTCVQLPLLGTTSST